jgi:hypothetical protein
VSFARWWLSPYLHAWALQTRSVTTVLQLLSAMMVAIVISWAVSSDPLWAMPKKAIIAGNTAGAKSTATAKKTFTATSTVLGGAQEVRLAGRVGQCLSRAVVKLAYSSQPRRWNSDCVA